MTTEGFQVIKHTNGTSKCHHSKRMIVLGEWSCCCYHRNRDDELVRCDGNAEVRAHVHSSGNFWLIPSCKSCNRAWKSKMYTNPDCLVVLNCDCAFKNDQTPMHDHTECNYSTDYEVRSSTSSVGSGYDSTDEVHRSTRSVSGYDSTDEVHRSTRSVSGYDSTDEGYSSTSSVSGYDSTDEGYSSTDV